MDLQEIINRARTQYPHWCKLSKKGGPDPRTIDGAGYGHFIRFPYSGEDNAWCFSSAAFRDRFCQTYGAQEIES